MVDLLSNHNATMDLIKNDSIFHNDDIDWIERIEIFMNNPIASPRRVTLTSSPIRTSILPCFTIVM